MASEGVIDDGAVFIDSGVIESVQEASAPPPDTKYRHVPHIRTGDTIFPGLIELHNHLSYNAMPLWDVPAKYSNNGQWRGIAEYTREITKPSQVLGQTPGAAQALVRYVECRAMLGGVSTSQGITLASAAGIEKYFKGLIRNVESPLRMDLPSAGTKIANPETGGAQVYLDTNLSANKCYLQHLSEGTDDTARGWFLRLRIDSNSWAVNDVLCGIHCAALKSQDLQILADGGASMVWSPLSNYLLYGATADIVAAKAAGMNIALGSDWAPSGSKNLLGELKVAWLASKHAGEAFTPEELVAMVTVNPARAAKWEHLLGSIQQGMLADLVAVNGRDGDPFEHLLRARETSVTLVVIDGVPRVGQKSLMRRFWPGFSFDGLVEIDVIDVGRSNRYLYLTQTDDLLEGLSLSQALTDLSAAMQNLPQLAIQVDNAVASPITAAGTVAFAGGMADDSGDIWRVVPDFEDADLALAAEAAARGDAFFGAEDYSFWVTEPIDLDPITAAKDPGYLHKLVRAPNLPEHVRRGLPAMHGESMSIPEVVGFLDSGGGKVADQLKTTTGRLSDFLVAFGELTLDDRRLIVDQAILMLQENYVHLPLKRAMHAVDPLQQLRLLRYRLDEMSSGEMPPEVEFHTELTAIFNSLRDLHTGYRLPAPFNNKVAWLPYLIEEVTAGRGRDYILTKWVGDGWPDPRMNGAVVTHWNGMPIDKAVARNSDRQAGSNPDARHARGLNALTVRPLASCLPPDEDWVNIRWLDPAGQPHDHRQEWLVFEPGSTVGPGDLLHEATALGVDDLTDEVQEARKILFAPEVAEAERLADGQQVREAITDRAEGLASFLPGVFRATKVRRSDGSGPEYGYMRIFTFNVPDADQFVDEFVRLVEALPQEGLIIDVRGNGGGLIYAAEQLLEVLTPEQIEPEKAEFINTPINLRICRGNSPSGRVPGLDLKKWVESIETSVRTGATYSLGFPITPADKIARLGQKYYGPVVLVTDPLCYSATDMFAAGFQDHDIGTIIGVGGTTGAGGANVWPHRLLRLLDEIDGESEGTSPYKPLPNGADIRVAIRRTTRVKERSGAVLEDLGVKPSEIYRMTRDDVTGHNEGLIDVAIEKLAQGTLHFISTPAGQFHPGGAPRLTLNTVNVDRVETTVNGRGLPSRQVKDNQVIVDLSEVVGAGESPALVRLTGFLGEDLVAERLVSIGLN
jgi:cytosine/adenosine deaminase-related metal-dependent hydrolase